MEEQEKVDEEQIVVMRNHALRLLKSKMRRCHGASNRRHHHKPMRPSDEAATELQTRLNDASNSGPEAMLEVSAAERSPLTAPKLRFSSGCCSAEGSVLASRNNGSQEEMIAQLKQRVSTTIVFSRQTSADRRKITEACTMPVEFVAEDKPADGSTASLCIPTSVGMLTKASRPAPSSLETAAPILVASHIADQSRPPLRKLLVKWSCKACKRECIPVREESRCLCGHRYKEHPGSASDPRVKNKAAFRAFACTSSKCACKAFFYVVAEGAWILRCRCKHKHTDHDPSGKPFRCTKPKCGCSAFDSPWICNCNHPWTEHQQEIVEKEFRPLELFQAQFQVQELSNVQRTDLVAEPLGALSVQHAHHSVG